MEQSTWPAWVSVRTVASLAVGGGPVYEERVTIWLATSMEDAIDRAVEEAREYAEVLDGEDSGLAQAFRVDGDIAEGAEIFSLLRTSNLSKGDYLDRLFDTGDERTSS